jgi:plasmid stabilization system protein ParE
MHARHAVIITPLAEQDLAEAEAFIARDSPTAARAWVGRVFEAMARLEHFPLRHRVLIRRRRPRALVRAVRVDSHLVLYEVRGSTVIVLRVWHAARRPPRPAS